MPMAIAIGNDRRLTQIRRRTRFRTCAEKPSSGRGSDLNIASSCRSSLSFIRSAILMIFDVKAFPDLFLAAEYDGFHRTDRQFCGVADLAV